MTDCSLRTKREIIEFKKAAKASGNVNATIANFHITMYHKLQVNKISVKKKNLDRDKAQKQH